MLKWINDNIFKNRQFNSSIHLLLIDIRLSHAFADITTKIILHRCSRKKGNICFQSNINAASIHYYDVTKTTQCCVCTEP